MTSAVGWGIVGFGWVARDYMAPAIVAADDRLVAVADPDPAARMEAAGLAARAYADVDEMVRDPGVEVIYVATPNHLHRGAVEAAARAGKAVLCEKPMAATLEDAQAMVAACRSAGVLYGTAFDQRHHPAHRAMRAAIAAGRLGTVTAIRIAYACWLGAEWQAGRGGENWRVDRTKAGGGALMDLTPHGVDLVEFLIGEPIETLVALTQTRVQDYAVDDGAMLVGRTASGVLASLHNAFNCPDGLPRRRLEVLGTTGQLTADRTMGQDPGGTLHVLDGRTGTTVAVDVPDAGASPFLGQVRRFGAALRGRDVHEFSGVRDLHTMRLVEGAYRSSAGALAR